MESPVNHKNQHVCVCVCVYICICMFVCIYLFASVRTRNLTAKSILH